MLEINLATRPFYNERAVHLGLALAAVAIAALTAFNVLQVVTLSGRQRELAARVEADGRVAEAARREAARRRAGLDGARLSAAATAVREANVIIGQRTFSWSALLDTVEDALPADVRLVAMRPTPTDSGLELRLMVVGRSVADIERFMERLDRSPSVEGVLLSSEDTEDDGTLRATVSGRYVAADAAALRAGSDAGGGR